MDVTQAQFPEAVLARSREVPVVVDFWAAWCAPCRALGPILEREVAALGGRVELKKVDVDRAQGLAGTYGVQGIPAVMAFRDGEVVADFVGARDAAFVRSWLEGLAPSPARLRLAAASGPAELAELLEDAEAGPEAALRLAGLELEAGAPEKAAALLARIPPRSPLRPRAEALQALVGLAAEAAAAGGEAAARARLEAAPGDSGARYALGCALAARGEDEAALEAFLEVVSRDRRYKDDAARKAMLTLFERLGSGSELARTFRRRLQVVL